MRRIVRAARPEKILLFGSAARGEVGPDSDYDLLIMKGGKFNYWQLMRRIQEHLSGKEAAVDVVLWRAEEVERYRDSHCLVICPALKEGRVVYDSEAAAPEEKLWARELDRASARHRGAKLTDAEIDQLVVRRRQR